MCLTAGVMGSNTNSLEIDQAFYRWFDNWKCFNRQYWISAEDVPSKSIMKHYIVSNAMANMSHDMEMTSLTQGVGTIPDVCITVTVGNKIDVLLGASQWSCCPAVHLSADGSQMTEFTFFLTVFNLMLRECFGVSQWIDHLYVEIHFIIVNCK